MKTRIKKETSSHDGAVTYTAQYKDNWGMWVNQGVPREELIYAEVAIDLLLGDNRLAKAVVVKTEIIEYPKL
jgi:hypothetical protein